MLSSQSKNKIKATVLNTMAVGQVALALAQANLGLKFIPLCAANHKGASEKHRVSCSNPGKVPLISKWPEKASDNPDMLGKWFNDRPHRNLGLILGGKFGVVGFDIDGKYGQDKMDELFEGSIPPTWQFSTPGGGSRYLFGIPDGLTLSKFAEVNSAAQHEELALLADGQMTVIPPSLHSNGGKYLWIEGRGPGDLPLTELPKNVLERIKKNSSSKNYDKRSTKQLSVNPISGQDQLNLLSTKCKVINGALSEQQLQGCSETQWHQITSMLISAGYTNTALAFSQLSQKHNQHSEHRIQQMNEERMSKSYGPTRCTTLGCDLEQIATCHSKINLEEETGNPKNSPASLLRIAKKKRERVEKLVVDDYINLMDSSYRIHENLLCIVKYKKEGEPEYVPVSNFVARIVKYIFKDNGSEKETFYAIDGVLIRSQRKLPLIQVPAQEFESMKWLTLWGPEPILFPGFKIRDLVRFAIQSTSTDAINERIYTHLGWINLDDKWAYLHAGGALGIPNVKVELESRLQNYKLSNYKTSNKKAMKASLSLLNVAPYRVTLILWAFTYLSPICEWLRLLGLEPKFLVWLHGYTGSRKTTLAKLFLCHFGNLLEHPTASFKDTANSVEKHGFVTKDSLLLIDDYHPTTSPTQKKSMESLAQQILRGYGDRVGRGRMKQDTSLRPDYPPRGNALVTAEDMISGGSSVARLFPVELLKADVDLDLLTKAQGDFEKLSVAMKGYLEWLGQSMSKPDHSELRQLFIEKRQAASQIGVHGRLVEAAVWLYLGLDRGLEYAESIGALTVEEGQQLRNDGWDIFLGIAKEQGQQVTEVKPSLRFLTIVSQLLNNESIYCDSTLPELLPENGPRNSSLVGWEDKNYYYFLPDIIYNEVCQFLSKRGEQFPISPNTLWKELAEGGLTKTELSKENGKERQYNLKKKTIRNKRQRLLWMKKESLYKKAKTKNDIRAELVVSSDDADELDLLGEI